MSGATPPSISLFDCFGSKAQGVQELQNELQANNAYKAYRTIENAVSNYLDRQSNNQGNISSPPNSQLTAILNFKTKGRLLKTIELFRYVTENYNNDSSRSYQSAKAIGEVLCRNYPEMAFSVNKYDNTIPLHMAARKGAVELVNTMVEELLSYLRQKNPTLKDQEIKDRARQDYLSKKDGSGKTAFLWSVEELQFDVSEFFLREYPKLVDMDSIKLVVQKAADDSQPGDAVLGHGQDTQKSALGGFKLIIQNIKTARENDIWSSIWEEAVKTCSLEIIRYLLTDSGPEVAEKFVNQHSAEAVMKQGSKEIWRCFDKDLRQKLVGQPEEKKGLLHLAVEWRNADLVEEIIEEFPQQVEVQVEVQVETQVKVEFNAAVHSTSAPKKQENPQMSTELQYPMQLLAKEAKRNKGDRGIRQRIRDSLLHAMIRSTNDEFGIREIRRILKLSQVDAESICLPLRIDTERDSFADYVQGLESQGDSVSNTFKFESVLKFVKCPSLHPYAQATSQALFITDALRTDYNEMEIMYNWLNKRKVEEVLDLSVPDRLFSPQSDQIVDNCVNNWKVRILRWRKLDIFLGGFTRKTKENLQELHLYSSGNSSVHEQWYRELPKFSQLSTLHVNIVTDILSTKRIIQVREDLKKKLKDVETIMVDGKSTGRLRRIFVNEYSWETDVGRQTYRRAPEITNDVVGPDLGAFIRKYQAITKQKKEKVERTKVAIIDSGIVIVGGNNTRSTQTRALSTMNMSRAVEANPTRPNGISEMESEDVSPEGLNGIGGGKSFVNTGDEEEEVWWHASEPHGTQMARLIRSVDPCCELYIAKVAETRQRGISPAIVAEAIRWATRQDVDVISLSLVTYTDHNDEMKKAIIDAKNKDIVILCSTVDEGAVKRPTTFSEQTHVNNQDVLTISACNKYGRLLESSQSDYSFGFFGHKVRVGPIPYLQSDEHISGSSVATAIAAGAASLVLAFCRLSKHCQREPGSGWRIRKVRDQFHKMIEDASERYVHLRNLCGKGKTLANLDFEATIEGAFRDKKKETADT